MLIAKNQAELEDLVTIRDTDVGKGVFACRFFDVGQTIGLLTGKLINDPAYDSTYCIEMDDSWSLEPDAPFRFINHSCDPNCWLISHVEDGDDPFWEEQLGLYVCRTIYAGEEITIDYAWSADSAIQCKCGSDNCRGWIVDVDELGDLIGDKKSPAKIVRNPRCPGNPNPDIVWLHSKNNSD
jgi:hypothetical protein